MIPVLLYYSTHPTIHLWKYGKDKIMHVFGSLDRQLYFWSFFLD